MLSGSDLLFMRDTQKEHMPDAGRVLVYTDGIVNEYNEQDAPTYPPAAPIICGLNIGAGSERKDKDMTVINYDAAIRVPLLTPVSELDRFEVVSRFGELIDPLIYEIVSPPQRGPTAIRLLLRKIVT